MPAASSLLSPLEDVLDADCGLISPNFVRCCRVSAGSMFVLLVARSLAKAGGVELNGLFGSREMFDPREDPRE